MSSFAALNSTLYLNAKHECSKIKKENTLRYSHITPAMINLHLLPVKFRIIFKVNLMTFKALHGLAPAYLSDIKSLKVNSNYNLRSNFSNLVARPAIRSAKTTGDRAFR